MIHKAERYIPNLFVLEYLASSILLANCFCSVTFKCRGVLVWGVGISIVYA